MARFKRATQVNLELAGLEFLRETTSHQQDGKILFGSLVLVRVGKR